ncbi:hypothetical protein CONCODRAFT_12129 [Conidiobolus coronatus NRRL 28638]|uniref:Uncharacterized protein n=1 Tax=Conidiobolus coronatus (strain ATCC 28846 / CBS 209.66 / NRRL 28638) TaxID=796925 RepID=A0A137NTG5_CONC2|nr:hypothetical protein CONCODRAFT_12129 [Conidiobolus coronatus NRRL 28638]|eukprot:KXN66095.1 hypothetical protein CONCODRAFT_12129 [Conidiobolus coronatus NRRL 28638]
MLFYKFISLEFIILVSSIPLWEHSSANEVIKSSQLERKAFDSTTFGVGTQLEHSGKLDKRDIYQFNNPVVGSIHLPLKMGTVPLLRSASASNPTPDPPAAPDESSVTADLFQVLGLDLS